MFNKAEEERIAVGLIEPLKGFVEQRTDLFPMRVVFGGDGIHGHGLLFAGAPPPLTAKDLAGGENGGAVQPAGEHDFFREGRGFARQVRENELGDVLGKLGIAIGLAERGRIDQCHVARNEFAEGCLGMFTDEAVQELSVISHFPHIQPQKAKSGQKKLAQRSRARYSPCSFNF